MRCVMAWVGMKKLVVGACLLCTFIMAAGAPAQEPVVIGQAPAPTGKKYVTLDLNNVDIRLFIQYISELSGKNFVIDKAVQGNVTILSPTKISEEEAYRVFESVLEVNGFTTVPSGSVIKIVPSATARSKSIDTISSAANLHPEDKVVTQLVPLKYSSPDEMKKVLTPLVSQTSVVISHPQSGMLILTETLSNIQRLMKIIESLDVEFSADEVAVIPLENAAAESIAKILSTIYQQTAATKKGAATSSTVKVVPYERVNAIVALAKAEEIGRVRALVARLDTPVDRHEGNIHVYYLQNANATELAKVLNALPEEQKEVAEKGKAPSISKNVKVMPDEETNSLIITASREEYGVLEAVIKKLDIPRQMVYLEALIMEVNTTKNFDVGVEWAGGGTFQDGTGALLTGFSGNDDAISNITSTFGLGSDSSGTELSPSLNDGFTFGLIKQGIEIGGVTFPNIGAVLRAYDSDSDINVIATPQILTTDNKKAEISVGENVPYITSQNQAENSQNYTQYDYRDVATTLRITPQINQAETLRLEIETEITRLRADSLALTPTTFKRTASTTVIVNDNDTVVIGGIIGQDGTITEEKIPLLGDIPVLGWLFKTRATKDVKSNMFIFITPRIVRNPADIAGVTLEKEDDIGTVLPDSQAWLHKEINPEHSMVLAEKGYQKLLARKMKEAEQYFRQSLEINPENPYAMLNMGVVAEYGQRYEEAIEYYQDVILLDPRETAVEASNPEKAGLSLTQIARENIERLQEAGKADLDRIQQ